MKFDFQNSFDKIFEWFLTSGLRILLIIVLAMVLLKIASAITTKMRTVIHREDDDIEFEKRSGTLRG